MHRTLQFLAAAAAALGAATADAQPVTTGPGGPQDPRDPRADATLERLGVGKPQASDGGEVSLSQPAPVPEAEDPVNQRVQADTVDGLVLAITIDGSAIRLDSASPARIPKDAQRANSEGFGDGGSVRAIAFAGGQRVGSVEVPDNVLVASEGDGLVRLTRRQITLAIPVERAVDRVEVEAPATAARATLDVGASYETWCRGDPRGRWCPNANR
jgi:hypothetical protein